MTTTQTLSVSEEETALLHLLALGISPVAIGRRLGVSERTVRRRTHALCEHLGVAHPVQAVVVAVKQGWIS